MSSTATETQRAITLTYRASKRERGENVDIQFNAMLMLKKPVSKYKKSEETVVNVYTLTLTLHMLYGDVHITLLPHTLITVAISRLEKRFFLKKITEPILA